MGSILFEQGELDKAVEASNKALAIEPNSTNALNNLGIALEQFGKLDEALVVFITVHFLRRHLRACTCSLTGIGQPSSTQCSSQVKPI